MGSPTLPRYVPLTGVKPSFAPVTGISGLMPKGTPAPVSTGRLIAGGGNPTTMAGPITVVSANAAGAAAAAMAPIYKSAIALLVVVGVVYLIARK